MKRLAIVFCVLVFTLILVAQNTTNPNELKLRQNAVYFEFMGNGFWYSVNYDKLLSFNQKSVLIVRVGFSYVEKVIPVTEVNFVTGNGKHFFETGLGYTIFYEGNQVFFGQDIVTRENADY